MEKYIALAKEHNDRLNNCAKNGRKKINVSPEEYYKLEQDAGSSLRFLFPPITISGFNRVKYLHDLNINPSLFSNGSWLDKEEMVLQAMGLTL